MLTTKQIDAAKPKAKLYRLFDGLGLYIEIHPRGGKYWRFKYQYLLKEKRLALGTYPEMSLVEAREQRDEARKLVSNNIDPSAQKVERRHLALLRSATTFELIGREWHTNNKERWSLKHGLNIMHRLEMDVFPQIGKMPITDIKPVHLLSALRLVENRGAQDESRRLLQYCGQIFRYAIITERTERDITPDLRGALKPYQQGHFNAIETKELPEFLTKFHRNDARLYPQTRHALQLIMLTFVRTTELIGAKWEEFDFKNKEWNIPAERMKMKRAHLVPLARQTIDLLERQKQLTGNWEWVFPNIARPKKHMSDCTILGALKRLGYRGRMTGHGFRALAMSTIKEKLHYRHEVVDRQLAHVPSDKLEAAYDRAKFLEERAVMMQDWADYLDKAGGTATHQVIHVDFSEAAE